MCFRDYLAVKAMESIVGHANYHPEYPSKIASAAYAISDAMIEARGTY
jgi:hypothetical protein